MFRKNWRQGTGKAMPEPKLRKMVDQYVHSGSIEGLTVGSSTIHASTAE